MATRDHANLLGSYLRARRDRVTPDDVGLASHGARRAPGLRREEVALLAGISADYYLRLERGKDARPSAQVLASLARALRLDDVHTEHLMALACEAPRRPRRRVREVPPGTARLVAALGQPAFVEDRFYDVLVANEQAQALTPGLVAGANQLRDLFLDPAAQALHPDWRRITECWVAHLRRAVGADVDDPQFVALHRELSHDAWFRELWGRHEVKEQSSGQVRLVHPRVGELTVHRDRFAVDGEPDLSLVVLHGAGLAGVLPDPRSTEALVAS